MKFGELELHILSDGTHTEDGGGIFEYFPRDIWSNYKVGDRKPYSTDEHNNIVQAANCLLIKHPDGNVLVETGIHDKARDYVRYHNVVKNPSLMESMKSAGIAPSDIDIVINSHLNPDHAGWNTMLVDGKLKPAFGNATYVIQKKEFKTALNPGFELKNDYFSAEKDVLPLEGSGSLELVNGEKELLPGIFVIPTPGHTSGHQSVIVKAGQETLLYAADMAALVMHQEKPRCKMAFDVLGREECYRTKKGLLYDRAAENNWFTYFYHEVAFTIGVISKVIDAKGENRYKVTEVSQSHPVIRQDIPEQIPFCCGAGGVGFHLCSHYAVADPGDIDPG